MTRSSDASDVDGSKPQAKQWSPKAVFREIGVLALMVLAILAFRSTFFSHYNVPTGSMIPTILPGDHFLANQMTYGVRLPFTSVFFTGPDMPKRGDIVVFPSPVEKGVDLVKRVAGLGGEQLEVRGGMLYINGAPIETRPIGTTDDGYDQFIEEIPERRHVIQLDRNQPFLRDFGPIEIPEGSFFPLGDNRDHSGDGRVWGPVPIHQLRARAMFILYSVEDFPAVRWDRTGHTLYELPENLK